MAASVRAEARSHDGGARPAIRVAESSKAAGGSGFDRATGGRRQAVPEAAGSGVWAGQASPVAYVARLNSYGPSAYTMSLFQAAANACDLNGDSTVNSSDVDLAINMSLGSSPCTSTVLGAGVCNVILVQRIINASMGDGCVTGAAHTVSLSWAASASPNVAGYSVYRGTVSSGPYTKLNPSLATGTSYVDGAVQAGRTYFYVVTAVDAGNNVSVYSNEAQAVVPSP
jgi:hypothetical protein